MSEEYVVTKIHPVSRASTICCSAAMSDGNILQTPKKNYPSSDNGNQSCCRLRGSVKDFKYCKNLFKKSNEELLAAAEAVYGGTLPGNELRPHLLCRPCERRLNNFKAFRAMITESQSHFQRSDRVKRCIEASPSAPRTLKSAKDDTSDTSTHHRRGLNFAIAGDKKVLSLTEKEVRKRKI